MTRTAASEPLLTALMVWTFVAWASSPIQAQGSEPGQPEPIKVVVVSMFEHGALTGDRPGEFQFWVERMPLARTIDFPLGPYPLRANDAGVLGVCIGGGIANAAATIMALGLDERFDLRNSY